MIKILTATRAVALAAALTLANTPTALAAASSAVAAEQTPLNLPGSPSVAHTGSSGGSIVRTVIGLLVVVGVIYAVAWFMRKVKGGRAVRSSGSGLETLAQLQLGAGQAVHLVRAGRDFVLVGVSERGVTAIHRYSEAEAREAGLIGADGDALRDEDPPQSGLRIGFTDGAGRPRNAFFENQIRPLLDRLREMTVRA